MAKILLVEDDRLIRGTIELILQKAGHTVTVAVDGEAGVASFLRDLPDLIITDIVMPEKDGLEAIREFRKHSKDIPIIAISGGGRTQNYDFLRIANQFGATEILRKPFANADLLGLVARCLG